MKYIYLIAVTFLCHTAFSKEISRKPSQVGGPISINNKAVLVGDLNCGQGLVLGQVLINTLDQSMLVSDLSVDGKKIELNQVQSFRLNDSTLFIKAPGLLIQASMSTHAKGQATIGTRDGIASVNGKKTDVRCFVPEISDFPM